MKSEEPLDFARSMFYLDAVYRTLRVIMFAASAAVVPVGLPAVVSFASGQLTLHGLMYKPEGSGPFPAILYNHGSAAGMLSQQAFDALGPVFVRRGWVFFGPYRRGRSFTFDKLDKERDDDAFHQYHLSLEKRKRG